VEEPLAELLAFVESNAKWWDDVAQQCERVSKKLRPEEAAQYDLLCAVYRERAQLHRGLVAKYRQRSAGAGRNVLNSQFESAPSD
jgi:hypothetical protein